MINTSNAIKYGNQALTDYQNLMVEKFGSDYSKSIATLKNELLERNSTFLIELGNAVYNSKLGMRRINESMERVVAKIDNPYTLIGIVGFVDGISEELSSFDFAILGDVAYDIGKDSVKALDSASIFSMDFLKKYSEIVKKYFWIMPIIIVFLFVLYSGMKDVIFKKVLK